MAVRLFATSGGSRGGWLRMTLSPESKDLSMIGQSEVDNGGTNPLVGGNRPFYSGIKLALRVNNYNAVSTGSGISTSEKIR